MKVVINNCFGGFGLSNEAVRQLVLCEAKCIETMTPQHYFGGDDADAPCYREDWQGAWDKEREEELLDIGVGFLGHKWNFYIYKDNYIYSFNDDYPDRRNRADKDLIAVVQKLKQGADGSCARLKIINIPKNTDWEIEEYDGSEHIAEKHRTWGN